MAKEIAIDTELAKTVERLTEKAIKMIVGKKIVGIRYLTHEEMKHAMWYKKCPVLILEDGTQVLPVADDEGNESGVLEIHKGNDMEILPSIR